MGYGKKSYTCIVRNWRIKSQSNMMQVIGSLIKCWQRLLLLPHTKLEQLHNKPLTQAMTCGEKLESALTSALQWFTAISAFFSHFRVKPTRQKSVRPAHSMQTREFCSVIRWDGVQHGTFCKHCHRVMKTLFLNVLFLKRFFDQCYGNVTFACSLNIW